MNKLELYVPTIQNDQHKEGKTFINSESITFYLNIFSENLRKKQLKNIIYQRFFYGVN